MVPNPKGKRPHFSQAEIETQLQQLYFLPDSSLSTSGTHVPSSLDLEHQLAPIIKNIHASRQQNDFLKELERFVKEKEGEIEAICRGNYQDFVGSVDKLLKVRQGTDRLKQRIVELNEDIQSSGAIVGEKKRELLQGRRIGQNIDETIEALQACLRVLDLADKVGGLIDNQKYYAALRSLETLQSRVPSTSSVSSVNGSLPFHSHMLSSLPLIRAKIRDSVTKEINDWLLEVRTSSGVVGKLGMEAMENRNRRWRNWKVKEQNKENGTAVANGSGGNGRAQGATTWVRTSRVNGPMELGVSEKYDYNILEHEDVKFSFKPLYHGIHIFDTLDMREDLQKSYQEDRSQQADLLFESSNFKFSLPSLSTLLEEIVGFFVIESHVVRTRSFRSEQDVDDLWDNMCTRVVNIVSNGLKGCEDPEVFLGTKGKILTFVQTLEGYGYSVGQLNALLVTLFERYSELMLRKFSGEFENIMQEDDHQAMVVNDSEELDKVVDVSWLPRSGEWSVDELRRHGFPLALPFSQTYPLCCIEIRNFVDQFYQFAEGFSQQHRDVDEVLRKSVDRLLIDQVSNNIRNKLKVTRNLSQLGQIVVNILFFQIACPELETLLVTCRTTYRGGSISLDSFSAFRETLRMAETRTVEEVSAKLDNIFELADYDWRRSTPPRDTDEPSEYLSEMTNFLTTVMGPVLIQLPADIKNNIYRGALKHCADALMSYLTSKEPRMISEYALAFFAIDVQFMSSHAMGSEVEGGRAVFEELMQAVILLQSQQITDFLDPEYRQRYFYHIQPRKLSLILIKLITYMNSVSAPSDGPLSAMGEWKKKKAMEEVLKAISARMIT